MGGAQITMDIQSYTDKWLRVTFQYHADTVAQIKTLPRMYRKWVQEDKAWYVAVQALNLLVDLFPSANIDPALTPLLKPKTAPKPLPTPTVDIDQLATPIQLYQHQREGAQWLIRRPKSILADDMGLGKSKQALIAAKAYGYPITVICPASLQENWRREAESVHAAIAVHSWAQVPAQIDGDYTLIVDEAHYAQTLKSARTKALIALAWSARAVWLLTGTPIKNGRPINLFPLLMAIQHPLSADQHHYEVFYCDARSKKLGGRRVWVTDGAKHLTDLYDKTHDVILRRLKTDVLDMPPKTRVLRDVEISKQASQMYNQKLAAILDTYQKRVAAKEASPGAEALVALMGERQAASLAKIEPALDHAKEALEQGQSVVLFTGFTETGRLLAEGLSCEFLNGDTPIVERQRMVDEIQSGPKKCLVATIGAGGVGFNITAATVAIMVDRPWTPGDAIQAEDRLWRIGQTRNVTIYWIRAFFIDRKIDDIIASKQDQIDLVLAGQAAELNLESAEDVALAVFEALRQH